MMATVDLIDNVAALQGLAPEWRALLEDSDANGLFLTHEWVCTWWRHLADGHRLRLLTVRAGGELIGVAPLALRPARLDRNPAFRCVELLGSGEVGSDYLDVIARRGHETEAVEALAGRLAADTHVLTLRRLRLPCLVGALAAALAERRWTAIERDDESAPFIPLSGVSFEAYLESLGSAQRYAFRRRLRALERSFCVELERVNVEAERPAAMTTLMVLHQARWNGRGRSEAFSRPELVSFHEDVSRLALERGWLRLFLLRLDGVAVAALYGFRYRDVFYFYQTGFDPTFAKRSVGLVLLGLAIRNAADEGVAEFDLLHGEEGYKLHWARQARPLRRVELYPPGPRGWLYRGATAVERSARRLGRAIVPRPRTEQATP